MPTKVTITAGEVQVEAQLNDSATAKSIIEVLPVRAKANRWGDEIYFSIPVTAQLEENSRDVMEAGELGYWPPGRAFCIFFGPTPASRGNEIRAALPVNVVGKITSDWSGLLNTASDTTVLIETAI